MAYQETAEEAAQRANEASKVMERFAKGAADEQVDNGQPNGIPSLAKWLATLSSYLKYGEGSPEGVVTANKGTLFLRSDGGAGTTLYVKESGTEDTGWVAK